MIPIWTAGGEYSNQGFSALSEPDYGWGPFCSPHESNSMNKDISSKVYLSASECLRTRICDLRTVPCA